MRFDLLGAGMAERDEAMMQMAWYEGLQLLPQHFQAMDARLDGLLHRQMLAASPYSWGIDRLEIDKAALASGTLRVSAIAGGFQDGLAFAWNAQRDGVLECALDDVDVARYSLVVPRTDIALDGKHITRFRQLVGAPVADWTNRDEKAAIVRWLPNLGIRRWDPTNSLYMEIPFLEVTRTASGFKASGFQPPAVRLVPDSTCATEIAAMAQLLRTKAAQLAVAPVPSMLTADFRCGLGWILSSLVAGLPRLEAQMASATAHPYDVFLTLCTIAGMVSPLAGKVPEYVPAYDHADPGAAILPVVRAVHDIVNGIGVDGRRWREVPFALSDGEWIVTVPAHDKQAELVVQAVFDPSVPDSVVASWLQHALICFADEKNRCRELRIRGLARRLQTSLPELGLSAAPGHRYVRISVADVLDFTERQLIIASPDERSGLVLTTVSLIEWIS